MPKMKTKSAAKKRFHVTASGKIKHKRAGKRHNLSKKSSKAIRQLRNDGYLAPGFTAMIKKYDLPYSN